MTDFSFVADQKVTPDATAEMTLYGITLPNGENPVLIGRCAGEMNKPYYNELIKDGVKNAKAVAAGAVSAKMLAENRDRDRALYPQFVLTGWRNVCDAGKKDVTFGKDACEAFLAALPDDVFDEARDFFAKPRNFRKGNTATVSVDEAIDAGKS